MSDLDKIVPACVKAIGLCFVVSLLITGGWLEFAFVFTLIPCAISTAIIIGIYIGENI